jgi:hypothetical protein
MPPQETHALEHLLRRLSIQDAELAGELEHLLLRTGQMLPEPNTDMLVRNKQSAPHQDPNNTGSHWMLVERFDSGDENGSRTDVYNATGDPITATFQLGDLSAWIKWDGCMELYEIERRGSLEGKDIFENKHVTHICNIDGWIEALQKLRDAAATHFRESYGWQEAYEQLVEDSPQFQLETHKGIVEILGSSEQVLLETTDPAHFTYAWTARGMLPEHLEHVRLSVRCAERASSCPLMSSYLNRRPHTFDLRISSPSVENARLIINVGGAHVVSLHQHNNIITYEIAYNSLENLPQ